MRRVGATSWTLALIALALLYVPLAAVAVASVNAARYGAEWKGFTWGWYASLFGSTPERQALAQVIRADTANSLVLAGISTAISTVLGTLLALALERAPWPRRLRAAVDAAVRLPLVVPDLLLAAALVVALKVLQLVSGVFDQGMPAMVIGHVTFQISFVCLVVHARLRLIGPAQLEAARDLYASGWYATSRILLPQLAPAILAGAMLAFTLSLDDFVISFFTSAPRSATLPMLIWAEVRRGVAPEIHALSTIIIAATAVLAVLATLLTRSREVRLMRPAALVLLALAAALHAADGITVFMYSEYIDPTIPAEFTKRTGMAVTIDVYEAQEEMLAKLQAGGAGHYDVLVASDVTIRQLIALKLIDRLDQAKLPNAKNLWRRFADPAYDRGNAYTLPYLWGTIGLAWQEGAIAGAPSWAVLFDPAKHVGGYVLMDEARSMIGSTLIHLGKPVNSRDPADLKAAGAALAAAKKDAKCLGFDNGVAALRRVSAGEAAVAVVYNGDAVREHDENPKLQFAVPAEGGIITVDNLCIAAKAPNPAGAHAFIDFLYEPAIAARNANTMRYATPNAAALPLIEARHRANPAIYPPDAQMDQLHGLEDLGADTRLYDETWTAIKSE